MAEKPAAEKTEEPTLKRLRKSREKGQVAQSEELPAAISIVVLVMILAVFAPTLLQWFTSQIKEAMSCDISVFADSKSLSDFLNAKISSAILIMCPILASLMVGSVIACVIVGGLNFSAQAVSLKLDAVDPIKGFAKLFNIKSTVKLGVSIAKLIFVTVIVWFYIRGRLDSLANMRWAWSAGILLAISQLILGMLIRVCVALLVIAAIDVVFQKWKHMQELKMTKQEVKQEHKESDGSPEVKGRIRRIQMEMARKRMLQEVPNASVVLVNPTHFAVALKYDTKSMQAPVMVAKGADKLAEKIREIARANGVSIIRRPELTRTIYSTVEPGEPIPQTLYAAVAEVLAMIYRLKQGR